MFSLIAKYFVRYLPIQLILRLMSPPPPTLPPAVKVTEGLLSYDEEHVRFQIADQLSDLGYNKGALLAAAHLLTDSRPSILSAAGQCGGRLVYHHNYYPRHAWAATGIVVVLFVCL